MKRINVKGTIIFDDYKEIYDFYGIENTSVSDVVEQLPEDGSGVEIIINSPGGMVDAGSEIYSHLKYYEGNVTAKIFAIAASAASLIAMGADNTFIAPTAQIMIHNVSNMAKGDYRAMQKNAGVLENYNKAIANAYMLKTGKSEEEILSLMNEETYFTAKQAVEQGFADGVLFDEGAPKVASVGGALIPDAVIEKTRHLIKKQEQPTTNSVVTDEQLQHIINEVTNNLKEEKPKKEPKQEPVKNNLSRLFLNL